MTSLLDQYASRLKVDQKRFIDRQHKRLKALGIQAAFTVSQVHVGVTAQKSYADRHTPEVVYGEWSAKEDSGRVVVTRTEYGYLPSASGTSPSDCD